MAELFRDNLDPNLKLYVEYSNEVWNWIFAQTHYCNDNGDQNVPWPERTVPFIQNALNFWSEEWSGHEDRMVRVVGVQLSWQDVSNRIVFNMETGSFDAFSPAAYFHFSEDGIAAIEGLGEDATDDDVLFWARGGMLENAYEWVKAQHEEIAMELDIPMIYYEGGQHLTPHPFGSDQPYNDALVAAQFHPGMYDLYNEWYDSLRVFIKNEPALLVNFSFIGPTSGKYGTWGLLQNQFTQNAPYDDAPKYKAVTENVFDCSVKVSVEDLSLELSKITIGPNPTDSEIIIETINPGIYNLMIFKENGVVLSQKKFSGYLKTFLPTSGIYFFRILETKTGKVTYRKVVVQK
jgi:hypothetical protein